MGLHLLAFLLATLNRIPLNDSLKRFLRPDAQAALAARAGYIMRPDAQAALAV